MKLIYSKSACSLSVHVLFEELGIPYEKEAVSLRDKTTLESYSPKSYVPILVLDNGEVLSEASCILQYLCEKNQRMDLLGGDHGTLEKFRCVEWLDFVSTEIHKAVSPLFRKDLSETFKTDLISSTEKRLEFLNDNLSEKPFLNGDKMTVADMYAFVNLRIVEHLKFDLNKYSNIKRYMHMMEAVPSVSRAVDQEESAGTPGGLKEGRPKRPLTEKDLAGMGLS